MNLISSGCASTDNLESIGSLYLNWASRCVVSMTMVPTLSGVMHLKEDWNGIALY
jgi:hypothetical protein